MRKHKNTGRKEFSILTLDDDPLMTSTLQAYFQRSGYQVDAENDPYKGIERVRTGNYDILLLDFLMSPICGDQVVEEIRAFNKDIFILLLTGHKSMAPPVQTIRSLDIQGYYEKSDRFDQLELLVESCVKSIRQMRDIKAYQTELAEANAAMEKAYVEIIETLRRLVDARNRETRGHSDRVSKLAHALAEELALTAEETEHIRIAALFHDIGKVGVPDRILLKPAKLSEEEFHEIKKYPGVGADILQGLSKFQSLAPLVRSHHERIDGKGYPDNLAGDEIPFASRIIAVADSFDAMISRREYSEPVPLEHAVGELERGRNKQFDDAVVQAFFALLKRYGEEGFIEEFCSRGEV